MKRHLKVRAELVEINTKVRLTIINQTHFGSTFGPGGEHSFKSQPGGTESFTHNGVCLYSNNAYNTPMYFGGGRHASIEEGIVNWVCIPGRPEVGYSTFAPFLVSEWPNVRAAIKAYNEWGETQ